MAGNTVRLHRVLATKPEKIYRAFTDADAMARWLPPNGFTGHVHSLEVKVGGKHRMSFTNFTTGKAEEMSVISGKLRVLLPNTSAWQDFGPDAQFSVPGSSSFQVEVEVTTAYLCRYLNI
jgi:uncharacterized protein YaiE (UPF0345 family)